MHPLSNWAGFSFSFKHTQQELCLQISQALHFLQIPLFGSFNALQAPDVTFLWGQYDRTVLVLSYQEEMNTQVVCLA